MSGLLRRGWVIALLIVAALWLPRAFALDQFVNADERLWLTRSGNFYLALSQGDWASTFQRHHPGVTVTYAGLIGYLFTYPDYPQDAPRQFGWGSEEIEDFLHEQGYDPLAILAAGRAAVVAIITLTLAASFFYATRLLGLVPALMGYLLLAFAPFHIAHSRFLHLDGLVSAFMLLAVLAWWHHLHSRKWGSLAVAILATGLAWLTRSPALFLGPLLAMTGLAYAAFGPGRPWPRVLRNGAILAVGALVVVVALWPAMWVDPVGSVRQVFEAAGDYAADGHLKPTFYNGEIHAADPGLSFYLITYLWRATPVTLAGLLLALVALALRVPPLNTRTGRVTVWALLFFAVSFTLFMNVGAKKFDRYILPVYPPLELVAGVGWAALLMAAPLQRVGRWLAPVVASVLIAAQAAFALPTYPYYITFYNPLMGGIEKAQDVMMIGWGEGADQVGRFLNTLPDAENLTVASRYYPSGSLSYFFRGESLPLHFSYLADLAAVYLQDQQRQLPTRRVNAYFDSLPAIYTAELAGIEYGKVVDLRNAPLPDYVTDWVWRDPDNGAEQAVIRLASYQVYSAPLQPGESLWSIFYIVNLAPIPVDLNVVVRVVDEQDNELYRTDGWPWGAATSHWETGAVWPDGHNITIPADTPPGYYRVQMGFYDPATLRMLEPRHAETGATLPDFVMVDVIRVGDLPAEFPQAFKPPVMLGDVALLGAAWTADGSAISSGQQISPGTTVQIGLTWEAQRRLTQDHTVFIHVVGPDGAIAAQQDKQPINGWMPMREWPIKQGVHDDFTFTLPADAAPGEYTLYTGFYDPATWARLPVRQGNTDLGDAFRLGTLQVVGN